VERVVLNALPQGVAALPPNIAPSGDSFAMVFMRSESTLIASEAGARSPQRVGRINPVTVANHCGRGGGVGRGRRVGRGLGVTLGLAVGVTLGEGLVVAVGVGVTGGIGVALGVVVAVGVAVGMAVGVGVGVALGIGVGVGAPPSTLNAYTLLSAAT
jgi:hypothetical protein